MTISVRSRIFVTTPDGRSHTGVVTGLRGQGMADLLLDDGRAIRQPVSALRPALARTNGRHARFNPRARRNTGDIYDQVAAVLVDPSRAKTVRVTEADDSTDRGTTVDELLDAIGSAIYSRRLRGGAAAWARGADVRADEIAEALRVYGQQLSGSLSYYLSEPQNYLPSHYTSQDPDAVRDYLLLYALRDIVGNEPPVAAEMQPGALYAEAARLLLGKEPLPAVSVVSTEGETKRRGFNDGELEALTGKRVPPAAYVMLIGERLFQDFAGPHSAVYKRPQPVLDALLTPEEVAAEAAAEDKLRRAIAKFNEAEATEGRVAAYKERKEADDKLSKLRASHKEAERKRSNERVEQAKRGRVRVDGRPDTAEALAASLQAALREYLPDKTAEALAYASATIKELLGVSEADARKLFLLATLHSLVELSVQSSSKPSSAPGATPREEDEEEDKPRRRPAKKLTQADQARQEKDKLRAGAVGEGRREDRTAAGRQYRDLTRKIGGVDLKTFTDTERAAYNIIRDPLRVTRDNSHLCGNALDGYAYTVATTTQKRSVRHWLTWRDLGFTEGGATAPLFTALVTARRGEKSVDEVLTLKSLVGFLKEGQALGAAYDSLDVVLAESTDKNKLKLTRTPVSRRLEDGNAYNEFEVNLIDELRPGVHEHIEDYDVVDLKPALQRIRAGSQTGSLYPRRPMPPESPDPGKFHPDAPVLLTRRGSVEGSYEHGAPDVFGFSVVREVETATAILDKFKPYPGYSYKDRNPYFSWQPEAAGQFSAMVGAKGERPCANPDMVAQLNALRKASYTIKAVVQAATRLNAALTRDDGLNTIKGERAEENIVQAMERATSALVRVVRLREAITVQKYIKGTRAETTSDFGVFTSSAALLEAVKPVPYKGQKDDDKRKSGEAHVQLGVNITKTMDIIEKLSSQALKLDFVRETPAPVNADPERVVIEPANVRKQLLSMAQLTKRFVNVSEEGKVTLYSVIPEYANKKNALFILVAGALCHKARLADIVASLVPLLDQLNVLHADEPSVRRAITAGEKGPVPEDLERARKALALVTDADRDRLKLWWPEVRLLLANMYGPAAFTAEKFKTKKYLSAKFLGLIDFLIAREMAALDGQVGWDKWDGTTSQVAAMALNLYASTFLGDPKVGGLLAHPPLAPAARTNAGRGSTETDDMVKRAKQSGYSVAKRLTPEEEAFNKEVRLRQQNMTRTDTRPLSYAVGRESEEAAAAELQKRVDAAAKAAAQGEDAAPEDIAQSLQRSVEFAQRSLVGGGRVAETEKGVKLHYTYNPLLFQLLRLYYHQDRRLKGQEPVPVPAAPTANPNPSPKRPHDIYTEAAEALALAADRSPTEISFFASSIPVLPPPPMRTTEQLATQIAERMKRHPKSYQKSLSRLARKQIPLVTVANELQKALPRVQDFLHYYRSRIEGRAAEGKVTRDADDDQKALLLFAVYQALSDPPGAPVRQPYTEASFSAAASIPKPRMTVEQPLPQEGVKRPESPLLKARQGDVFKAPEQAQNLFRGFSRETTGADKKAQHEVINESMLRMIDWVGVYGSLLDLVRRSMLAFKRSDRHAPTGWGEVQEGWVRFFESKVMNSKMKDIPQLWLDLCPIDETVESWAGRYRAMRNDEYGETIRDTVLWAKSYAARGLSYAGALARRGFGPAEFTERVPTVPTQKDEDLFVRRTWETENDTIQALRALLKDKAKELQKNAVAAGEAEHAKLWGAIATQGFSALGQKPITSNLIYLSLKPLQHAKLLEAEQVESLREALLGAAPDKNAKFLSTIVVPHALFKAYVAALMRLGTQRGGTSAPLAVSAKSSEDLLVRRPVEEENDTIKALRALIVDNAEALRDFAYLANLPRVARQWDEVRSNGTEAFRGHPVTSNLIYFSLGPLQHAGLLGSEQSEGLRRALFGTAPSGGGHKLSGNIVVPRELFKDYVAALLQLRLRSKESSAPKYPTAPSGDSVRLIRATAADVEHEPADSFISISLDREDMRKLLLGLIEEKRKDLSVQTQNLVLWRREAALRQEAEAAAAEKAANAENT